MIRRFVYEVRKKLFRWLIVPAVIDIQMKNAKIWGEGVMIIDPTAHIWDAVINVASGNVYIHKNVFFGHGVKVLTGSHDYRLFGANREEAYGYVGGDIIIEEGAWIASGAIILGPCKIGKNSVVGAGSVVTKDVPPLTVVAGNPAKILRLIETH